MSEYVHNLGLLFLTLNGMDNCLIATRLFNSINTHVFIMTTLKHIIIYVNSQQIQNELLV